ncbi:MAG: fumarate hydratase, partial [Spirochaetales bacterium]|nr:fumarate hydratase [Candidatus Physcosoma equi]
MKAEKLICEALIDASRTLPKEVESAIRKAQENETGNGKVVLNAILKNIKAAEEEQMPLCQDTGMVWCSAEIGRDAHCNIQELEKLILRGTDAAMKKGYFRRSIVTDPMGERKNTGTNLPPVIDYSIVSGSDIVLNFLLKGFGSENCSSVRMLNPTAGEEGVVAAVKEILEKAGAKPCPPVFLGVGVGGTMDRAAVLSKKAFFKKGAETALEKRIKDEINKSGNGPGGL